MTAFTAMLSELYGAFRRKVDVDEPPTKAAAETVVIEDTRFCSIGGKFDALSHTMGQRFDALSHRFDVLNQPCDGLTRVMDQRFDALDHATDQRLDALSRAMDQRFASFGHEMGERFDALDRMLAARDVQFARLAAVDVSLEHLETKTATEFRYLRWGLGIVIALVLGLVTKAILDWLALSPIASWFSGVLNLSTGISLIV
jgi:hypothetical protein